MEVTALLKKIRDSHDMLKYLQDKKFQNYMKYSKERVIKIESDGTPDSDCDAVEDEDVSSAESQEDYLYSNFEANDTRETDTLTPIKNAIGYSIVRGMNIPRDEKQRFIMKKNLSGGAFSARENNLPRQIS